MTLFDTSVIIDARDPDSPFHEWAKRQIARAVAGDGAAVNTVIISEASVRVEQRAGGCGQRVVVCMCVEG